MNTVNIPDYDTINEIEIAGSSGTSNIDGSISYRFSNHWAISAGGSYINRHGSVFFSRRQNNAGLMVSYLFKDDSMKIKEGFIKKTATKYPAKYSLSLGYNKGWAYSSDYSHKGTLVFPGSKKDSVFAAGDYSQVFLQLGIIVDKGKSKLRIATRLNYLNFYNYSDSFEGSFKPVGNNAVLLESYIGPSYTLSNFDIFIQIGASFPVTGGWGDIGWTPYSANVGIIYNIQTLKNKI